MPAHDVSPAAVALDDAHETFRNELASVAPDGRRRWVYARQPAGRFYRARTILSWVLLTFLVLAPFVKVGGLPLMMFNVLERRFVLFGVLFWPQDFYLVVLLALAVLVTLMLSTVTVGRVWCGWLCPQTVFMEMLFRKLEYLIDGSAAEQLRRHRGPWTADRVWRTLLKQGIFFGLSFVIANVFLAYIIGSDALWQIVIDPPRDHLAGLVAITLFSGVFYAVFARFREQACVLACPYGRVMSSFIDRHTITVTYDFRRGEPRGRLLKSGAAEARGDCVDCHQCVTVCPTGIDIRHGVQLECVNCTACIDACDDVMTRLERPRGLIRLTSHEAVAEGRLQWLTPRVMAYAAIWIVLAGTVAVLLVRRPPLDVVVLRQPGTLFATLPDGRIGNFYNVQVFNRTGAEVPFEIVATAPAAAGVGTTRVGRSRGAARPQRGSPARSGAAPQHRTSGRGRALRDPRRRGGGAAPRHIVPGAAAMRIRWHWGTGMALAYTAFALSTLGFVVFAMSRPATLVSVEYYRQALAHDRRLEAEANARALGPALDVHLSADRTRVVLQLPGEHSPVARGTVTLYRPSDPSADRVVPLSLDANGAQRIPLEGLPTGRWRLLLEWSAEGRPYYVEQAFETGERR